MHVCPNSCAKYDFSFSETQQLIERDKLKSEIVPGLKWARRTHNGQAATIKYEYRVVCDTNYYGSKCKKYCKPRNNRFGHYTCNSDGIRVCIPGWTGPSCDKGG